MTATLLPNAYGDAAAPDAPLRPDNSPFRFEMLFDGLGRRAYADTADDLLAALIRDYDRMNVSQRLAARLHLAARTQVTVQADINSTFDLSLVTPEEAVILQGHRNTAPDVTEWTCPVPLVLIDLYYAPLGALPRPIGSRDVAEPDNIIWLTPADPYALLTSLHRAGLIVLNEHVGDRI